MIRYEIIKKPRLFTIIQFNCVIIIIIANIIQ